MNKQTIKTYNMAYERWKKAYYDVRSILDHMIVQEAIMFAHKNPDLVFGKDSNMGGEVKNGFLSCLIQKVFKRSLNEDIHRNSEREVGSKAV